MVAITLVVTVVELFDCCCSLFALDDVVVVVVVNDAAELHRDCVPLLDAADSDRPDGLSRSDPVGDGLVIDDRSELAL